MKLIDITEQRFNNLIAIRFYCMTKERHSVWVFRCVCGKTKKILACNVKSNKTKSCGCKRLIILNNKNLKLSIRDWAKKLKLKYNTITKRLNRHPNWKTEKILGKARKKRLLIN